jgi:metal-responsive CopG/Arc/MetJ family transcriptional regulator
MMSRINVVLPDDLLQKLDLFLKQRLENRSRFLRNSIVSYMEQLQREEQEEERKNKVLNAIARQDEIRRKPEGDS